MVETKSHEGEDSTTPEESSESFSPEAGGTSVSFRPGPHRFLPEFERKPWWLAPGAIVMVPLVVMLLAAWAIPERIGSEHPDSATRLPMFGETRSSPSRNSSALDEDGMGPDDAAHPSLASAPSSGARRVPREASARPARRGFSPVREREDSPMREAPTPVQMAPPPPADPEPSQPELPIARSNAPRGGRALSVVSRPDEHESTSESESSVSADPGEGAAEAPEGTPATDVSPETAPAQPEDTDASEYR